MLLSLVFQRQKITKTDLISFFGKGPAIWFILYYVLLVIGLLWLENQSFAISKLENKMSFVLMPLLLFFTVRKWNNFEWKQLLICALLFAWSCMKYWQCGDISDKQKIRGNLNFYPQDFRFSCTAAIFLVTWLSVLFCSSSV